MVVKARKRLGLCARRTSTTMILAVFLASSGSATGATADETRARLQELAYREALFHHHREDHFEAITRLQTARANHFDGAPPPDMELLLVRMKLAYGLHDDTDRVLRRLLENNVSADQANEAWYELAQTLFHKGYPAAANQALANVRGRMPDNIEGPYQLLQGNVLMALRRYAEAAQALEHWRGPRATVGYAYFNRGIALLRAQQEAEAIRSLKRVAGMRAEGEEHLALRDKANLTLGYVALRSSEPAKARAYFKAVRSQGPYSNRALLALGLVEQGQGRNDEALTAWLKLRERSMADPAVQESYLAIPYALREQQAPEAAKHYEQAVASLSRELDEVNRARAAVEREDNLALLLREAGRPAAGYEIPGESATRERVSRYVGGLLARRQFMETSLGHQDLLKMLDNLDRGMEDMDRLGRAVPRSRASTKRRASVVPSPARGAARPPPTTGNDRTPSSPPLVAPAPSSGGLEWRDEPRPQGQSRGIPTLPEIDLPPEADRTPLPNPDPSGLPESDVIGFPPAPEIIGPDDVDHLPPAPEVVWLPPASTFRTLTDEEFAYPDLLLPERQSADATRRLVRRTTPDGAGSDVLPDVRPGGGLGGLSRVLDLTDERIAQIARRLRDQRSGIKDYRAIIAALRERARRLRERIAAAIELHERFAKAMILDELEGHQRQIELYLEQARLELAKTYDLATETSQ